MLQDTVDELDPLHDDPPPDGLGLVQDLVLVFVPPPHVSEQEL